MPGDCPAEESVADPEPATENVPNVPVVDAHVHLLPRELLEAVSEWFEAEQSWSIPVLSPATVVERIDRRADGFVFFPYAHEPGVAASLNDLAAGWQSGLEDAVGLGTVHAGDDDPGAVVDDLFADGLSGVKLHCPVQEFTVDDDRLDPVYEALVARDAPLVVHASTHPFYRGDAALGPDPLRDVLERFPGLRVCVPHLGLFETDGFLDLAADYDVYFDTAVALGAETHDYIGASVDDLPRERLRSLGDRVMFGSDYPVRPQSYEAAFRGVASAFPGHERDVFYRNAREFFDADFGIST